MKLGRQVTWDFSLLLCGCALLPRHPPSPCLILQPLCGPCCWAAVPTEAALGADWLRMAWVALCGPGGKDYCGFSWCLCALLTRSSGILAEWFPSSALPRHRHLCPSHFQFSCFQVSSPLRAAESRGCFWIDVAVA